MSFQESQKPPAPDEGFFRGTVNRVSYRHEESGFGILKAEPEAGMQDPNNPQESLSTIVGVLPSGISPGTSFVARGKWHTHPKFGRQFKALSLTEAEPTGRHAVIRYLASGAVRGFGPVLAERVVDYFGDQTLEILDTQPERLEEVPGIGKKKLEEILQSWGEKKNQREVLLFFQNHNIAMGLAQRIYNQYKDRSIELVSKNPYVLCQEVWGIGFLTADKIAQNLGLLLESSERIQAGITYSLEEASLEGHCYLPREVLHAKAKKLLSLDDDELISQGLAQSGLLGNVIEDAGLEYLPLLHRSERYLAANIAERLTQFREPQKKIPSYFVDEVCEAPQTSSSQPVQDEAQSPLVIRLSPEQKRAVELAANESLLVITGGPGCGKTTVVRAITSLFKRAGLSIKLAAPTGRAAQRLQEVCGLPASTIHRLLKFDPINKRFVHDVSDPLVLDVLIVDESSMIDLPLAAALLRAVPAGARIIVVGDADQLPSVGPGLFLADLLQIEQVPRVRLTTLFRRGNESSINEIAHSINAGHVPDIPEPDGTKRDAYFLPARDSTAAAERIEQLVVDQIPKKFGIAPQDITVLSPMNQGELGIIALNQRLQGKLVPPMPGQPSVKLGAVEFRVGDRVCQRVNNYNLHDNGVYNGEQGVVYGIDTTAKNIYVKMWDGREVEYTSENIPQLDLAYALTIHRSQGSEVPAVVLALHDAHHIMLERQLLYTAVTRAKKLLIIVGSRRALERASRQTKSTRRFTALSARVTQMLEAQ